MDDLVCWRCGASAADEPLPLARASACLQCRADLHVCKLCEFYATGIANDCREPIAERVVNKERANFCGYFKPRARAFAPSSQRVAQARDSLDALFGGVAGGSVTPTNPDDAKAALDALFKKS